MLSCFWRSHLHTSFPLLPHLFPGNLPAACLLFMSIYFTSRTSVLPLGSGETSPSPAFRGVGAARGEGGEARSCWGWSTEPALTLNKAVPGEQREEKVQQPVLSGDSSRVRLAPAMQAVASHEGCGGATACNKGFATFSCAFRSGVGGGVNGSKRRSL